MKVSPVSVFKVNIFDYIDMKKIVFLLLLAFAFMPMMAGPKGKKERVEETGGKVPGKVYIFGCSSAFGDSVIYITDIQELDSTALSKKTKFLPYRSDYSMQLKEKLESKAFGLKNQTSSVFFAEKKEKLERVHAKLKKRYIEKMQMKVVPLSSSEFKFIHALDYYPVSE